MLADALIDLTISGSALQIKYMTFIIYNHMNMTTKHAEHGYETQNMAIKTQKMAIKHGTAIYYDYQSPTLSNGVKLKSHLSCQSILDWSSLPRDLRAPIPPTVFLISKLRKAKRYSLSQNRLLVFYLNTVDWIYFLRYCLLLYLFIITVTVIIEDFTLVPHYFLLFRGPP